MRIGIPKLRIDGDVATLSAEVKGKHVDDVLWFRFDKRDAPFVAAERMDPFLVAVLHDAVASGEDILLDGAVSELLAYNVSRYAIPLLSRFVPNGHVVAVEADRAVPTPGDSSRGGVGTGLSCGVDGLYTFVRHFVDDVPARFRLTDLFFFDVGSHYARSRPSSWIRDMRHQRIMAFAAEQKLDLHWLSSNVSEIFKVPFERVHLLRNLSAALVFQGLLKTYIYSASIDYSHVDVGLSKDISAIEAILVPLLDTDDMRMILCGAEVSRIEKTRYLLEFEPSHRYLDVCAIAGPDGWNCGVCWKCKRTLITLDLLGALDKYTTAFDIPAYRRSRRELMAAYLVETAVSKTRYKPTNAEVVELLRNRSADLPRGLRASELLLHVAAFSRHSRFRGIRRRATTIATRYGIYT